MKPVFALLIVSTLFLPALPFADEQQNFIDEMSTQHGFDPVALKKILAGAEKKQAILEAIARPAEKRLTWTEYRNIFVKPKRIDAGVKFWQDNRELLEKAYTEHGVPPEIITAIIGVETFYGRFTGGYRVLDALTTLGFYYPPRANFFRSELSQFLRLAREEEIDPGEPTGSYAGAMGKPQFIPSSYRHYAIDFDGDGKRDIWNNNADVIGSVANYFSEHGWRRDQPVTSRLDGVTAEHDAFISAGMKPGIELSQLNAAGITTQLTTLDPGQLASVVELITDNGNEYWAGLHNFYVITRYNHSNMYAMAVYQLSQAIRQAMTKQ